MLLFVTLTALEIEQFLFILNITFVCNLSILPTSVQHEHAFDA